jgi:hypothetical protein
MGNAYPATNGKQRSSASSVREDAAWDEDDIERVSLCVHPIECQAQKLDTGGISPNSSYFVDMSVSASGAIAFAGTSPTPPAEIYYKSSVDAPVRATSASRRAVERATA